MAFFTFLISSIFFIFSIVVFENKPLHPATLFFGLYSFILFLSGLNFYDILKASDESYTLILIMLLFFWLGSFRSFVPLVKTKKHNQRQINITLFYVLSAMNIALLLKDIFTVVYYVRSGVPIWQVRNWSLAEMGADNPIMKNRTFIEELVRALLLNPFGMAIPPIAAYTFFDNIGKKIKIKILILVIGQVILTSIAGGGGRLRLVYFGGVFVIAYLLFSNKKLFAEFNRNKYRKYIVTVGGIIFIGICIATVARVGNGALWKQIYRYFALPPTLLTVWLPEIKTCTRTCGFLTFYGVIGYFFRTLKMIGLNFLVPNVYDEAFNHLLHIQEFRNVGYGVANAFVTPVYYMMVDGGIPFLCIVSFFLSSLAAGCHKRIKRNVDICSFSIYAMMMYGVFQTFMNVMTAVPSQIITFILIIFLCKKRKED